MRRVRVRKHLGSLSEEKARDTPFKVLWQGARGTVICEGDTILKAPKSNLSEKELDALHKKIREMFPFLPKYYGVKKIEGRCFAVVERVTPVRSWAEYLIAIKTLYPEAMKRGLILDPKPANFGTKDGRWLYLDETGVGRGKIPDLIG